jgi:sugar phosphate isomerase/epimerase
MNTIRIAGQVITCTNYTATRLFNFNPEPLRAAADAFLRCGVTEIEIPEGVLDPEGRCRENGLDEPTLKRTLASLPKRTRVTASYFGSGSLGQDNAAFLASARRKIDHFVRFFPHLRQTMLHPPSLKEPSREIIRGVVAAWAELARYAAERRPGFQCCLHNHYDTSCETAEQVCLYLDALADANEPALRWGPDTGHSHGMGDRYLEILDRYAPLVGNHFHIKARVPAFDQLHGRELYRPERDIWGNKAEFGKGLYGGFVNCADPEIQTPFKEVFAILRRKARPAHGVITGAVEIDIPRQHPRLEVLCSVLYLTQVHKLQTGLDLGTEQIVSRAFRR